MQVHLISPAKKREPPLFRRELFPPLGLMTLAAYTPEEIKLRLFDENVEPIDFSEIPDLVGITTMTATARRAYEIAHRYRELGARVVLGGIHTSMVQEEALEHADSIVIGEAESIWPQVISDAAAGKLRPLYRQESFIDYKHPLPPRRDVINPKRYWISNIIQTSRGCPHDCIFCSVTAFNGRRPRNRDLDNVLAEVDSLPSDKLFRRKIVGFVDDNIAANPRRAKELFKELIPMKVLWGSQACITFGNDEELVALAAESGCRFLLIGLETLSPEALLEAGKRQNKVHQYEEALRRLQKYGIQVLGAFIFGFDSDEESAFSDTLDFAVRNKLSLAQFSFLTPYPGTRLYQQLGSNDRLKSEFWLKPFWHKRVVYKPKKINAERLAENTYQIQKSFYSYRSILSRISLHQYWSYMTVANLIFRFTVKSSR
jgi:radical SAM superfamily enzyme YgiQ (UPF0313 family)